MLKSHFLIKYISITFMQIINFISSWRWTILFYFERKYRTKWNQKYIYKD